MPNTPPNSPRIDIASLLHRQVDVVVAGAAAPPEPVAAPAASGGAVRAPEASAVVPPADRQPTPVITHASPARNDAAPVLATPTPGFLRRQVQRPAPWWLWVVVLLLGLGLALQVLLADRHRLAADPALRPLLTELCSRLGCQLPTWHQPDAYTMIERNVVPLPGHPGVLEIRAELRNDAAWVQALPVIELTLSTADGQVSGQRAFLPTDYLPSRATATVKPGQKVRARWLVAEPDVPADAFHFRFR